MKKDSDGHVQLLLPWILRGHEKAGLSAETEHELIDALVDLLLSACEGSAEENTKEVNDESEAE